MDISAYVLSIVGTVIFSVVVGMILPEGQIAVFVRSTIALFLFFVIVSPLLGFFDSKNTVFSSETQIEIQKSFLSNTFEKQMQLKENQIEKKLETELGIESNVEISYILKDLEVSIENVIVFVSSTVLGTGQSHIDMNNQIRTIVSQQLEIDEEKVLVNG